MRLYKSLYIFVYNWSVFINMLKGKDMFKVYICLVVLNIAFVFNNWNRHCFSQNIVKAMEETESQDNNLLSDVSKLNTGGLSNIDVKSTFEYTEKDDVYNVKLDVNEFFSRKIVWPDEYLSGLKKDELISAEDAKNIIKDFDKIVKWKELGGNFSNEIDKLKNKIKNLKSEVDSLNANINFLKDSLNGAFKQSKENLKKIEDCHEREVCEKKIERLTKDLVAKSEEKQKILLDKKESLKLYKEKLESVNSMRRNWAKISKIRDIAKYFSNLSSITAEDQNSAGVVEFLKKYSEVQDILTKSPNEVSASYIKQIYDYIDIAINKIKKCKEYILNFIHNKERISLDIDSYEDILRIFGSVERCLNIWHQTYLRIKIAFCGKFYDVLMNKCVIMLKNCHDETEGDSYFVYNEYLGDKLGVPEYREYRKLRSFPKLEAFKKDVMDSYKQFSKFFYISTNQKNKNSFNYEDSISKLFESYSDTSFPAIRVPRADLDKFFKGELDFNTPSESEFSVLYDAFINNFNKVFGPVLDKLSCDSGAVEDTLEFCRRFYTVLVLGHKSSEIMEQYTKEYNALRDILVKAPNVITPEEKKRIIEIYRKTVVLGGIFRKFITYSRSYLPSKNYLKGFIEQPFEKNFSQVFAYSDFMLRKFEMAGSAIKDKFKYSEFEKFLGDVRFRKSEEFNILGDVSANVNKLLYCLKYENKSLVRTDELGEQNLKDFFNIKLVEPTRNLFGLKLSRVISNKDVKEIYNYIKLHVNEWKDINKYYKILAFCGFVENLVVLDSQDSKFGDAALIGIYKKKYNNMLNTLQKSQDTIDNNKEKENIEDIYCETEKLILFLRELLEDIRCEFFMPEYEYEERFICNYDMNSYFKDICCYIGSWISSFVKIREAILRKFPKFVSKNIYNKIEKIVESKYLELGSINFANEEQKTGLNVDVLNKETKLEIKTTKQYKTKKPSAQANALEKFKNEFSDIEYSKFIEQAGLTEILNMSEIKEEVGLKGDILKRVEKLKKGKELIEKCLNERKYNVADEWFVGMKESLGSFSENLDIVKRVVSDEDFEQGIVDKLYELIFKSDSNKNFCFNAFCREKFGDHVDFIFDSKAIKNRCEKLRTRKVKGPQSGLLLMCESESIFDLIKTTRYVMNYVCSDYFIKFLRCNIAEIVGLCKIENKFLKRFFCENSVSFLDGFFKFLKLRVLYKVNFVLEFYFSELTKCILNFKIYLWKFNCFGFNSLLRFSNDGDNNFYINWASATQCIGSSGGANSDEAKPFVDDIVNDFGVLWFFCKEGGLNKALFDETKSELDSLYNKLKDEKNKFVGDKTFAFSGVPFAFAELYNIVYVMKKALVFADSVGKYEGYLEVLCKYLDFIKETTKNYPNMPNEYGKNYVEDIIKKIEEMADFVTNLRGEKLSDELQKIGLFGVFIMAHMGAILAKYSLYNQGFVNKSNVETAKAMKRWEPNCLKDLLGK